MKAGHRTAPRRYLSASTCAIFAAIGYARTVHEARAAAAGGPAARASSPPPPRVLCARTAMHRAESIRRGARLAYPRVCTRASRATAASRRAWAGQPVAGGGSTAVRKSMGKKKLVGRTSSRGHRVSISVAHPPTATTGHNHRRGRRHRASRQKPGGARWTCAAAAAALHQRRHLGLPSFSPPVNPRSTVPRPVSFHSRVHPRRRQESGDRLELTSGEGGGKSTTATAAAHPRCPAPFAARASITAVLRAAFRSLLRAGGDGSSSAARHNDTRPSFCPQGPVLPRLVTAPGPRQAITS
eukprot:252817-Chlamydomonas_euryale.AAC.3